MDRPPLTLRLVGQLYAAFTRVGLFGFGGGPSMIPLVKREVTGKSGWLRDDEFLELYAVASSMPGPIATNLAGYLGWRLAGPLGAVAALLALTLPSGIAIVAMGGLYTATKDSRTVQDALAGVRPVVIALLLGVAVSFVPRAMAGATRRSTRAIRWIGILLAFITTVLVPAHPAAIIALGAAAGLIPIWRGSGS